MILMVLSPVARLLQVILELNVVQLFIIGTVASLISQGLKLLAAKAGYNPSKLVMTLIAFVVSLPLAFYFLQPALPDPASPTFINDLVNLVTAVLGAATIVYNVLIDKLADKAKLTAERFLKAG